MGYDESELRQTRIQNPNTARYVNVLDLLETTPFLKEVFLDMSAFDLINQNGVVSLIRNRKPKWSDDFTYEIMRIIRMHSNIVTSQTDMEVDKIDQYIKFRGIAINQTVFYTGRSHFITPSVWKKLLKYWEENGKDWQVMYISEALVEKNREGTDFGDFGLMAKNLVLDVCGFIKDAKYRSRDALTLKHHQIMERVVERHSEDTRRPSLFRKLNKRLSHQNDVS